MTTADRPGGRRRLDQHLVSAGLFTHREQAKLAVLSGWVLVNGQAIHRPGHPVSENDEIQITQSPRYVSRGGDKLAGALDDFRLDVTAMVALDAGASTGGFVDCLLQRGAAHVVAVDVGYGQLAWKLRQDPRVTVIERQNIRYLTSQALGERLPEGTPWPCLITLDLSFIGLEKVFPTVKGLVEPGGLVMPLVKPQFQVGRGLVGKGGVVRRPELHKDAITGAANAAMEQGFEVLAVTYSKLKGPQGNIEYFLLLRAGRAGTAATGSEKPQLEKTGAAPLDMPAVDLLSEQVVEAARVALGAHSQ
jgi:23S rRNA (cytidine1920-2'-O)/16S rRNA (cytidine1409-2'-O)-methyltransferase